MLGSSIWPKICKNPKFNRKCTNFCRIDAKRARKPNFPSGVVFAWKTTKSKQKLWEMQLNWIQTHLCNNMPLDLPVYSSISNGIHDIVHSHSYVFDYHIISVYYNHYYIDLPIPKFITTSVSQDQNSLLYQFSMTDIHCYINLWRPIFITISICQDPLFITISVCQNQYSLLH